MERFALGSINLHMVINFEDRGLAQGLAVSTLSIFAATSALTGLPWGFVFEHLQIRIGAMIMSGLLVLSMIVLLVADNYALAVLFALLFGVAIGAGNIIENQLWADYFGARAPGGDTRVRRAVPHRQSHWSGAHGVAVRVDGLLHRAVPDLHRHLHRDDRRDVLRHAAGEASPEWGGVSAPYPRESSSMSAATCRPIRTE